MPSTTSALAAELHKIYLADGFFPAGLGIELDMPQAYQAQFDLLKLRKNAGEVQAGWKVGLTSKAMQKQQGVNAPCLGHLLISGQRPTAHQFAFDGLKAPGFENELCFELKTPVKRGATLSDIANAIKSVAPALEIIEKRSPFGGNLSLAIAANAQQHSYVTGEFIPFDVDFDAADVLANIHVNGQQVEQATGVEVLGNPLNSILWLAEELAQYGCELEAGDLIMSGSFTRQYAVEKGDSVRADFSGIGSVSAGFI